MYTEFRVSANSTKNIAAPRNVTFPVIIAYAVGRGSAVGIGIRCRLDGPGIESRWGSEISAPARPAHGRTQPPIKWLLGLPGIKRPECGVNHQPNLAPRLKKE